MIAKYHLACYNSRMVNRLAFQEQVRKALMNLYDHERLSELLLGGWLQAQPGYTGQQTLRQILLDAIEALKPGREVPLSAPNWLVYRLLFYRFVQCMTVAEVSSQLGFGERHFRRHQARAIALLADALWERYLAGQGEPASAPADQEALRQQADVSANLAWLESGPAPQHVSLGEVMAGVEGVLRRLISAQGVRLEADIPADLPFLNIHPLAVRQVLANTLSYAASLVPGGCIAIRARSLDEAAQLEIVLRPAASGGAGRLDADALAISSRLLAMARGSLEIAAAPGEAPAIVIQVPTSRRLPVLIIDDNADTARLFARYLAGSRYQPVIAQSSREALALAQDVAPCAVVLDVMMPEQDGWEVLGLFRAHPLTEVAPIIVATILTDRELALSLGAADFLHKPVSQEELLAALDRWVG